MTAAQPGGVEPAPRRLRPAAWSGEGFPRLALAWVFTNFGDSALFLMVAVWVKELTGSDVAAAMVFVCFGLPAVAAPFLGMLADQVSRRGLLICTNAALVPIVLSLLTVDGPDSVWIVYLVMLLYGASGYLTAAAQSGLLRAMLRDDQLASGNGILSTIDTGLRIVSPLIGTALYVSFGPQAVIAMTAVCFTLCAIVLIGLRVPASDAARPDPGGYWSELVAGFVQLFRAPGLGLLTVAIAIAFGATGLLNVIVFPALDDMRVDPTAIGLLMPLQGVGAVIGGLISALLIGRLGEGRAAALALVLLALGSVPFVSGSAVLAGVGLFVMGVGIPIVIVSFSTLRQRLTPGWLQGRTSAAGNVAVNVPQTTAMIAGAALLTVVAFEWLLWTTVVLVLVGAVLAGFARVLPLTSSAAQSGGTPGSAGTGGAGLTGGE